MVILIWPQVGFAMVLLSAAIKGVPEETRRGGSDRRRRPSSRSSSSVVVPQIRGTMIAVFITVLIVVLKVFDIVYVTTAGDFETNVVAGCFYDELLHAAARTAPRRPSSSSCLIAVLPALLCQIRHFRAEEAAR